MKNDALWEREALRKQKSLLGMARERETLRETIRINGGRRAFKKTGNALLLSLLADMAAQGELVKVGETNDGIIYSVTHTESPPKPAPPPPQRQAS